MTTDPPAAIPGRFVPADPRDGPPAQLDAIPVLTPAQVAQLPGWTVDDAAREWVLRDRAGRELDRRPLV